MNEYASITKNQSYYPAHEQAATRPFERLTIRTIELPFLVKHEEADVLLGRPLLTYAVDEATGAPGGYALSFGSDTGSAFAECLMHAMYPKTHQPEEITTAPEDWPVYGVPEVLVTDNSAFSDPRGFQDACTALGTLVVHTPPSPRLEAAVSGFFERAAKNLSRVEPYLGRLPKALGEDGYVAVTPQILSNLCDRFFRDWFHGRIQGVPGGGRNETPAEAWGRLAAQFRPRPAPERESVRLLFAPSATRNIMRGGIEFHGLRYHNEALARLRASSQPGRMFHIKYDPENLSAIHIYDDQVGCYLRVPCLARDYAERLPLAVHRVIRRYAVEHREKVDLFALEEAKRAIIQLIEGSESPRGKARRRNARWEQTPGKEVSVGAGPAHSARRRPSSREANPEARALGRSLSLALSDGRRRDRQLHTNTNEES